MSLSKRHKKAVGWRLQPATSKSPPPHRGRCRATRGGGGPRQTNTACHRAHPATTSQRASSFLRPPPPATRAPPPEGGGHRHSRSPPPHTECYRATRAGGGPQPNNTARHHPHSATTSNGTGTRKLAAGRWSLVAIVRHLADDDPHPLTTLIQQPHPTEPARESWPLAAGRWPLSSGTRQPMTHTHSPPSPGNHIQRNRHEKADR